MKKLRNSGNFFAALLFNMLMSLEWTIPAWLLLACHFFFDWSIRWFWIALGVWLLDILLKMELMSWAARCGRSRTNPRKTKIPIRSEQNRRTINYLLHLYNTTSKIGKEF